MPQARSTKNRIDQDDDAGDTAAAGAAADRNADRAAVAAEAAGHATAALGRARPRYCRSDDGLSKAFSFLSGYRPAANRGTQRR